MEADSELKMLLQRESEIQDAMRRPGGIRITVERELFAIREQLRRTANAITGRPDATRGVEDSAR